ncbi:MAG: hypothetical protein P1U68_06585 [Verrucomicrobiales bacterium]|nr:hypothetical protein [Verrucomicrobiales bacterium]
MKVATLLPAATLFFLSPWVGEVISGFLTAGQFLEPSRLLITLPPYGCGALIARELMVRHHKGWPGLLMFGLAFGIFFEGIITRVFVNPDPGILAPQEVAYQRVLGWNWANTIGITHFHALLAIVTPVFLTEMLFPKYRRESWISRPMLWGCCIVMLVWPFVLGRFANYLPPLPVILSALLLTGFFLALGLRLPTRIFRSEYRKVFHPFWLWLVCTIAMALIMIAGSAIPGSDAPPPLPLLLGTMFAVITLEFAILAILTNGSSFGDRHRLAMVLGWLTFFLFFSLAKEIEAKELTQRGLSAGTMALLLLFLCLRSKAEDIRMDGKHRERSGTS